MFIIINDINLEIFEKRFPFFKEHLKTYGLTFFYRFHYKEDGLKATVFIFVNSATTNNFIYGSMYGEDKTYEIKDYLMECLHLLYDSEVPINCFIKDIVGKDTVVYIEHTDKNKAIICEGFLYTSEIKYPGLWVPGIKLQTFAELAPHSPIAITYGDQD